MKGMCCVCQNVVPVVFSHVPRQEERDRGLDDREIDDREIDMVYGECINYVTESHDAWGQFCEGSGQVPQVLLS